jgi:hypothetical protein
MQNLDDMHKMSNANTGATMRSFDAVTKGTQANCV